MKIFRKALGVTLVVATILALTLPITYAGYPSTPDVVINITDKVDTEGETLDFHMEEGSDYGWPWCPGIAKKSIVRLTNGNYFKSVTLANLGVWINNLDESMKDVFADNMMLTIKQGNTPDFNTDPLYDGKLSGILYQAGSDEYKGLDVDLGISSNGHTDLEYTLAMKEDAGPEMQGLSAELSFFFNMNNIRRSGGDKKRSAPPKKEWYEDCVEALIAHGIIVPETDGELRPDDPITRAEVAMLMARALSLEMDDGPTGYLDSISEQYRGYINATTKAGVFKGYPLITDMLPGRVFKPNNNITREELFCVLVRAYDIGLEGDFELGFIDKGDISDWALEDVKAGVQNGIVEGYPDNTLKPGQFISRAEAFVLVCKLQGYHQHHDSGTGGGTR